MGDCNKKEPKKVGSAGFEPATSAMSTLLFEI